MRVLLVLVLSVLLSALPATMAQDPDGEPGCVEANPCEFIVAVDAEGFSDVSVTEFTSGDWVVVTLVNHDTAAAHTVKLGSHALDFTVAADDVEDSEPFRLGTAGKYTLTDQPSGDVRDITVLSSEEFDDEAEDPQGAPGLEGALLLAGLAMAAVVARRRA